MHFKLDRCFATGISAVPSLTLFGLEMQKISLNISVKEAHIEVVV